MGRIDAVHTPDYIVNIRWLFEGVMLPAVGTVGILGKDKYLHYG